MRVTLQNPEPSVYSYSIAKGSEGKKESSAIFVGKNWPKNCITEQQVDKVDTGDTALRCSWNARTLIASEWYDLRPQQAVHSPDLAFVPWPNWIFGLWLLWIIWDAWSMLAYDGLVQHLVIQNPKACSLHRPFDLESRVRTSDMTIWALWDVVCRMRLFLICGSSGAHISKRQRHSEMVAMVIHGHSSVICAWSHTWSLWRWSGSSANHLLSAPSPWDIRKLYPVQTAQATKSGQTLHELHRSLLPIEN